MKQYNNCNNNIIIIITNIIIIIINSLNLIAVTMTFLYQLYKIFGTIRKNHFFEIFIYLEIVSQLSFFNDFCPFKYSTICYICRYKIIEYFAMQPV